MTRDGFSYLNFRRSVAKYVRAGAYNHETSTGYFGRQVYGTYWIPECECGDEKNGEVVTTYNVKAPR